MPILVKPSDYTTLFQHQTLLLRGRPYFNTIEDVRGNKCINNRSRQPTIFAKRVNENQGVDYFNGDVNRLAAVSITLLQCSLHSALDKLTQITDQKFCRARVKLLQHGGNSYSKWQTIQRVASF